MVGTLVKGLGHDHVFWGTDLVWYGSPQWQIEAFRRLEIPEDMQKKHGFAALGPADGAVKSAIFGYNAALFYKLDLRAELPPMHEDGSEAKACASRGRPCAKQHRLWVHCPPHLIWVDGSAADAGPAGPTRVIPAALFSIKSVIENETAERGRVDYHFEH